MLTEKALNDFKTWIVLKSDDPNVWVTDKISVPFEELNEVFQIALILEWFESEGIFIFPERRTVSHRNFEFEDWYVIITNHQGVHLNNFLHDRINIDNSIEIKKAAIKKANEIYNKK